MNAGQDLVRFSRRAVSTALAAVALISSPGAIEPGVAQTVSGMADGYFSHNFNQPPSERNRFRAFDTHDDEFRLNGTTGDTA